jgi:hypothetical protein
MSLVVIIKEKKDKKKKNPPTHRKKQCFDVVEKNIHSEKNVSKKKLKIFHEKMSPKKLHASSLNFLRIDWRQKRDEKAVFKNINVWVVAHKFVPDIFGKQASDVWMPE